MEAAAKLEHALRPLNEHRWTPKRAAHLMPDDDAAHRRRDDRLNLVAQFGWDLRRERLRQPLCPGAVHQYSRALQIARAAKPGREDEMALEQRIRRPEFGENVLVGHHKLQRRLGCFGLRAKCRL